MNIEESKSRYLLPSWMKSDAYDVALSEVMDEEFAEIRQRARLLTVWDHLDELPEAMLDEMAVGLHIEWYDTGAPIETKRELIRTSDLVHLKKGTVAAVETVIQAYFGSGYLMEWPEYGGEPHHFKVFTSNPSMVAANQLIFEDMLRKTKRHSSKLDSILIGLTGQQYVLIGSGARDFAYEMQAAGVDRIYAWGKAGAHERETVCVRMGETGAITPEEAEEALRAS